MPTIDVDSIAQALLSVYDTHESVAPITDTYTELTLDDGYAVQLRQVKHWAGAGQPVRGYKVGLTSAAIQRQLGVAQPDFGHLTANMFQPESTAIAVSNYISPRIEPEIALVLGRPLAGPGITAAEAMTSVEYVLPALEIIDSRVRNWQITLLDTVADNASSGGVVLGCTPVTLRELTPVGGVAAHERLRAEEGRSRPDHRRRRRDPRISDQRVGLARQHPGPTRRRPGSRFGDHVGILDGSR